MFAPDDAITYGSFGAAVGFPMAVVLPMIAILSITSEWSQRTGLTSFTLVPHRGRVIRAKLTVALSVGVVSMLLAFGVGALGNLLGAAIVGVDPVWDITGGDFVGLILFQILNMLVGFMLGVLFRNSAGAIVGYFVYSFVLGTITQVLPASQDWFERIAAVDRLQLRPGRPDRGLGHDRRELAAAGRDRLCLAGDPAGHRPGRGLPLRGQVTVRSPFPGA